MIALVSEAQHTIRDVATRYSSGCRSSRDDTWYWYLRRYLRYRRYQLVPACTVPTVPQVPTVPACTGTMVPTVGTVLVGTWRRENLNQFRTVTLAYPGLGVVEVEREP